MMLFWSLVIEHSCGWCKPSFDACPEVLLSCALLLTQTSWFRVPSSSLTERWWLMMVQLCLPHGVVYLCLLREKLCSIGLLPSVLSVSLKQIRSKKKAALRLHSGVCTCILLRILLKHEAVSWESKRISHEWCRNDKKGGHCWNLSMLCPL